MLQADDPITSSVEFSLFLWLVDLVLVCGGAFSFFSSSDAWTSGPCPCQGSMLDGWALWSVLAKPGFVGMQMNLCERKDLRIWSFGVPSLSLLGSDCYFLIIYSQPSPGYFTDDPVLDFMLQMPTGNGIMKKVRFQALLGAAAWRAAAHKTAYEV